MTRKLELLESQRDHLDGLVEEIWHDCPGQSEFRYLSYLRDFGRARADFVREAFRGEPTKPLAVSGLPQYKDVQRSKILALLLGESLGNCVAYSDYNQSYLTDIRPSAFSRESSADTGLLGMHNDFPFIADESRPRILVLLPHLARGNVPQTFLAPADDVVALLDPAVRAVLTRDHFEARVGGKLAWKQERVYRFSLLETTPIGNRIRFHFDTIRPAARLSAEEADEAQHALDALREAALSVGREQGHRIQEGEALIIPNDHCLHGRDVMDTQVSERLLLRSYVVPDEVVAYHNKTMITLDA